MTETVEAVHYAALETAVGRVLLAYRGSTVIRLSLQENERGFATSLAEETGLPALREDTLPAPIRESVIAHINGRRTFSDVDLSNQTPFQRRVLQATAAIPRGEVRTYGEIAVAVGAPGGAQAVGQALKRNPIPVLIPCHRVVRSDGALGFYSGGGPTMKQHLLAHEGVTLPLG